MHADDVTDLHARRIATDAQGQRLKEVSGETGQVADVSFVDSLGRLDLDDRRQQTGTLDDQVDLDAGPGLQVREPPVRIPYRDRCTIWMITKCSSALPYS